MLGEDEYYKLLYGQCLSYICLGDKFITVFTKYFFAIVVFPSSYLSLSAEYICRQALNVQ